MGTSWKDEGTGHVFGLTLGTGTLDDLRNLSGKMGREAAILCPNPTKLLTHKPVNGSSHLTPRKALLSGKVIILVLSIRTLWARQGK